VIDMVTALPFCQLHYDLARDPLQWISVVKLSKASTAGKQQSPIFVSVEGTLCK
jgi:carbonic anhydrase